MVFEQYGMGFQQEVLGLKPKIKKDKKTKINIGDIDEKSFPLRLLSRYDMVSSQDREKFMSRLNLEQKKIFDNSSSEGRELILVYFFSPVRERNSLFEQIKKLDGHQVGLHKAKNEFNSFFLEVEMEQGENFCGDIAYDNLWQVH